MSDRLNKPKFSDRALVPIVPSGSEDGLDHFMVAREEQILPQNSDVDSILARSHVKPRLHP